MGSRVGGRRRHHNVYNGIEDILLSLARDIDGYVPTGGAAHQEILDQMTSALNGTRPALLGRELHDGLFELKSFRHLVRHKYGMDLKPEGVVANLALIRTVFPAFVEAVARLEQAMRADDIE